MILQNAGSPFPSSGHATTLLEPNTVQTAKSMRWSLQNAGSPFPSSGHATTLLEPNTVQTAKSMRWFYNMIPNAGSPFSFPPPCNFLSRWFKAEKHGPQLLEFMRGTRDLQRRLPLFGHFRRIRACQEHVGRWWFLCGRIWHPFEWLSRHLWRDWCENLVENGLGGVLVSTFTQVVVRNLFTLPSKLLMPMYARVCWVFLCYFHPHWRFPLQKRETLSHLQNEHFVTDPAFEVCISGEVQWHRSRAKKLQNAFCKDLAEDFPGTPTGLELRNCKMHFVKVFLWFVAFCRCFTVLLARWGSPTPPPKR